MKIKMKMMMKKYAGTLGVFSAVLALVLCLALNAYAGVSASVNTTRVTEGGVLQLQIKADGDASGQPDISSLSSAFEVRNSGMASQNTFINGQFQSSKTWTFTLAPRKSGTLTIPAIAVGKDKTVPITVVVSPASASANVRKAPAAGLGAANTSSYVSPYNAGNRAAAGSNPDIFIESFVENKKPYVQAQVVYITRFYTAVGIGDSSWPPPSSADIIVEPLTTEDLTFDEARGGRNYKVVERRFAIFPQKSGRVEIPPSEFTGMVFGGAGSGFDNMLMSFGFGSGFTMGSSEPVKVKSNVVALEVQPKPAAASVGWWLPAYDVKITEEFEPALGSSLKQNEAVTRKIKLVAEGLLSSQLPEIPSLDIDGVKTYPAKSERNNRVGANGIVGELSKSTVIIPTKAGELTLPEVKISWWNVATKQMEEAILPAHKFTVAPAKEWVDASAALNAREAEKAKPAAAEVGAGTKQDEFLTAKNMVLLGLIGLLLLVVAVMLYLLLRKPSSSAGYKKAGGAFAAEAETTARESLKALTAVLKSADDNPKEVADALMSWGKKYWKDKPPINITAIAGKLKSAELKEQLEELNRSIYAAGARNAFDKDRILKLLTEALARKEKEDKKGKAVVPPLYPK